MTYREMHQKADILPVEFIDTPQVFFATDDWKHEEFEDSPVIKKVLSKYFTIIYSRGTEKIAVIPRTPAANEPTEEMLWDALIELRMFLNVIFDKRTVMFKKSDRGFRRIKWRDARELIIAAFNETRFDVYVLD